MSNNVIPASFEVNNLPETAFGDLRVAELTPQFQGSFEYTVDNTEISSNTVTGGGSVTQSNAMAVIGTSSTTASSALLKSKRHAKYRAGFGGLMRFTALFQNNSASTEQYFGVLDEAGSGAAFKNGLAVGFDGETFGYHRFASDVKYTTDITSWDDPLDGTGPSGQTIDHTKLNIWYIQFGYLGALGPVLWFVGQDNVAYKVHTMPITGVLTEPTSHNPNYHFTIYANNKATTSDLVVKSGSYAYFIEGKTKYSELQQPQFSSSRQQATSVTTETAIFTIRNKSTYASKTNFIDLLMEFVSLNIEASSANNLGEVRLVRDATLGGSPSYSDINTSNSVAEIDTSGTTVTGGKELIVIELAGRDDKESIDLSSYDIILAPGETITVAGSSGSNATIRASILWKELF